ncbi:MAG: O-methyltransferase [Pedosphaera sp.]|nr:O-methyltransferase [Pedosphaera sp.]
MKAKTLKPAKLTLNLKRQKGLKYVALNERVYNYLAGCRSRHAYDRVLEALRAETNAKAPEYVQMQIARDQGSFMTLLVAAIGARSALEVGTFTGYSSICIAQGLPARGQLLCLDLSEEWTAIARKYWARAGVEKKIELRLGPAIESLKKLRRGLKFDFAFIDAHKPEYDAYYELVLPHMRRNGLILFDNMLWGGRLGKKGRIKHEYGRAIDKLNRKLARDGRVESMLLSLGDGINICRVK